MQSLVYKNKAGNKSPRKFSLKLPNNEDKKQKTVVLFAWESTVDDDSTIPVTYNLLLSDKENFNNPIVYRQEGLTTTMAYIDKEANVVKDQTTYYWKVEAVDSFGAKTTSSVFTFDTNNTNAPPSIGSVHVSSALDFTAINNADISLLDENGKPLPYPDMYKDNGNYNMLLPHGRRRARIRVAGYAEQVIDLDTTQGTAVLNIEMKPIDKTLPGKLQFLTTTYSVTESDSTINLNVARTDGSYGEVSVQYFTNGTAT